MGVAALYGWGPPYPFAVSVEVLEGVVSGHPAPVLIDLSASARLLVVGSRGHGGFAGSLLWCPATRWWVGWGGVQVLRRPGRFFA